MQTNLEQRIENRGLGFTVVELLVAMGVFTALLSFAVGVFIQGMQSQRGLTEEMAVNNEMSLALEQVAREMRTGSFFSSAGGYERENGVLYRNQVGFPEQSAARFSDLQFEDEAGNSVSYYLSPDKRIFRRTVLEDVPVSGTDVLIDDLAFFVRQEKTCHPWRITMFFMMRPSRSSREPVPFQTTISSRVLPLDLKRDDNKDGKNDFAECRERLVTEQ